MKKRKTIEVVAAIIENGDKILCVQRGENKLTYISKKFEFPGGKVEKGETLESALSRELQEELQIEPDIQNLFLTVKHSYPDFDITMHSFICKAKTRNINLTEHINSVWLKKDDLTTLDWAAADIPIINKLARYD
ncbi:(deoxy)nucleoside triphosphate pyrophosphohydrolase [Luteirhabdus pelagi]|uniref:(deoxy)nucleoside triphosphate pyrophosphohydrolase n=1 Tax=Luteirhabdus pelagi TaxID=2792783 RepID=UPI00193972AD|nr:(deoxy)nucleoside triphosphate pyrophosphohydrolase [Luteirhabdus pelagi]